MNNYKQFSQSQTTSLGREIAKISLKKILTRVDKFKSLKSRTILEIGPGEGLLADMTRKLGAKIVLIEPSDYHISSLKKKGFEEIKKYFVPPIKLPDNIFDAVFLMSVFEHMDTHKDAIHLIKEVKRVLKKDGILILYSPEILFWGNYFWDGDYTHNYVTTRNRLGQMFAEYEFEVLKEELYSGPFSGFWTPIFSYFAKSLFFVDWMRNNILKRWVNRARFTFMTNLLFIVKKKS